MAAFGARGERDRLSIRLWSFQRDRFPLASQGALALAFAGSCVFFASAARGAALPPLDAAIVVIVTLFLLFFQLRVADEHRDAGGARRRLQAGVISLEELAVLAFGAGAIQAVVTWALHPPLLAFLVVAWIWIWLVWNDFFARRALARRPGLALGLQLAFLPIVSAYAIGAVQLPADGGMHGGFVSFALTSLANGAALEIARKINSREDDAHTAAASYTKAWGPRRAGMAICLLLVPAILFGLFAFIATRTPGAWFLPAALIGFWAFVCAGRFAERPTAPFAIATQSWVATWAFAAYLALGFLPVLVRMVSGAAD